MQACFFADIDRGTRGLTDDSAIVGADPEIATAAYEERIDGFARSWIISVYANWTEVETIEGSHTTVGRDQQPAAGDLCNGA